MHATPSPWPPVAIVVAVLNEAALMSNKLRELAAMDYPAAALTIIVVDGGSSDGTQAIVAAQAAADSRIVLIETTLGNKVAQINEALAVTRAPWVLVTDADARVPADTLTRAMRVALADGRVAVVGTTASPRHPHPLDASHWWLSNALRRAEHVVGRTTGLVVAPCYLFRRALVDRLPDDAVADDVYVACRAAQQGCRVALLSADVEELRSADRFAGWFGHKTRRTMAYLREIFRFLPAARSMREPMRSVFLWRAAALTAGPPVTLVVILVITAAAGPAAVACLCGVMLAAATVSQTRPYRRGLPRVIAAIACPFWLVLVTLTALVKYPFVRQRASFPRETLRTHETEIGI